MKPLVRLAFIAGTLLLTWYFFKGSVSVDKGAAATQQTQAQTSQPPQKEQMSSVATLIEQLVKNNKVMVYPIQLIFADIFQKLLPVLQKGQADFH